MRWSINATSGFNRNEVKDNEDNATLEKITNGSVIIDGFALNSFWSFPYIGLSDQGVPKFAIIDQTPGTKTRVESGTLLDYMIYSGVKDPVFSGGLSTSFRYKQFTLSASFNFQLFSLTWLKVIQRGSLYFNEAETYERINRLIPLYL